MQMMFSQNQEKRCNCTEVTKIDFRVSWLLMSALSKTFKICLREQQLGRTVLGSLSGVKILGSISGLLSQKEHCVKLLKWIQCTLRFKSQDDPCLLQPSWPRWHCPFLLLILSLFSASCCCFYFHLEIWTRGNNIHAVITFGEKLIKF